MDIHVKDRNDVAADVFALITYVEPNTGDTETLWNARVSDAPETVPHRITGQKMYRVLGSVPAAEYRPQPGERVIQDMSLEVAREYARESVLSKQNTPGLDTALATFSSLDAAIESFAQYLVSQAKEMVTVIDADWRPTEHERLDPAELSNMQKSYLAQTYQRAAEKHYEIGDPRQRYGRILFSDRNQQSISFERWRELLDDSSYRTIAAVSLARRGDLEIQARVEWVGCHCGDNLIYTYGYYCFCHRCGESDSLTAWVLGLFSNPANVRKLLDEACADPRRERAVATLENLPESCHHNRGREN